MSLRAIATADAKRFLSDPRGFGELCAYALPGDPDGLIPLQAAWAELPSSSEDGSASSAEIRQASLIVHRDTLGADPRDIVRWYGPDRDKAKPWARSGVSLCQLSGLYTITLTRQEQPVRQARPLHVR